MKKILFGLGGLVLVLGAVGFIFRDKIKSKFFEPRESTVEIVELTQNEDSEQIEVIAEGLQVPWEIEFLPNNDMLVTERPGTLKRIGQNNQVFEISGVEQTSEGGLLGLALHPNFESNNYMYLYLTAKLDNGLINRVERYTYNNDELTDRQTIIDNIPGAQFHDGGRIAFGPDDKLYIATGDALDEPSAQDVNALSGKILRINDDGSIPADNPFNNATWSYGHRNPQGIAWGSDGAMYSSEHGPSGANTGFDEVNLIEPGNNYGWPTVKGDETGEGFTLPLAQSGSEDTWAPADIAVVDNLVFFTGLRGSALYYASITQDGLGELTASLREDYGRLRASVVHEDSLYVTTSNTDGRGSPKEGDDKIIRIPLSLFE